MGTSILPAVWGMVRVTRCLQEYHGGKWCEHGDRLLFKPLKIFFIPIYKKGNASLYYLERISKPCGEKINLEVRKLRIHCSHGVTKGINNIIYFKLERDHFMK